MLQLFCLSRAQEPYILRYAEQQQQISPTKVGTYDLSQMGFYLVTQWIGIAEAPNEKCIWFNKVYTTQNLRWGGVVRNRSTFIENNTTLSAQFSYPLRIGKRAELLLGLQGEINYYDLNFSRLRSVDGVQNDPLLQRESYFKPNVGIGLAIYHQLGWFQFALPKLLNKTNSESFSDISVTTNPTYFIEFGKHFSVADQESIDLRFQIHNLIWNKPTAHFQIDYGWRNLAGTLAVNDKKMIGLGFSLMEKRIFTLRYGYQWKFHTKNSFMLNQHLLGLVIRFNSPQQKA
ncbi:MAG: type IX secretion system membrane protein PorP/SprF [Flavobacteriaceae bacterium]|nr:type IX secretion system membrane protein PorP/SprF [Flavobacteriaceae bacterium]